MNTQKHHRSSVVWPRLERLTVEINNNKRTREQKTRIADYVFPRALVCWFVVFCTVHSLPGYLQRSLSHTRVSRRAGRKRKTSGYLVQSSSLVYVLHPVCSHRFSLLTFTAFHFTTFSSYALLLLTSVYRCTLSSYF